MKYSDIETYCTEMVLLTPKSVERYLDLQEARLYIQTFLQVLKGAKAVKSGEEATEHFKLLMSVITRTLVCDAKLKEGRNRYAEAILPKMNALMAYRFESTEKYIGDMKKLVTDIAGELIKWKEGEPDEGNAA